MRSETANPTVLEIFDGVVAVYKPAGIQVHRQHSRDEGPFLLQQVRDLMGHRVYPLHRLDKPTAGILILALDESEASRWAARFRERTVEKRYWAVVRGHLNSDGRIDYPLKPVRDRVARRGTAEPQSAVTDFVVLQRTELPEPVGRYPTARYSLLELSPQTGRRHQLRRHMKHVFHPIVGDPKYGDRDHNRYVETLGYTRLALCALRLGLPTEAGTKWLNTAPDEEWLGMARALGFSLPESD